MNLNRRHAGWALTLWALGTVFLVPFMEPLYVTAWLALGAALGIVWKVLPEGPPLEPEKLPYHDEYAKKQIPKREGGDGA